MFALQGFTTAFFQRDIRVRLTFCSNLYPQPAPANKAPATKKAPLKKRKSWQSDESSEDEKPKKGRVSNKEPLPLVSPS